MILNRIFVCFCISLFLSLGAAICPLTERDAYEAIWEVKNPQKAEVMEDLFRLHPSYSFDYDPVQKKIAVLQINCTVLIYSKPKFYKKLELVELDELKGDEKWNDAYRKSIVFHKGQIFFIQRNSLYCFSEATMKVLKQWRFEEEYCKPVLLKPDLDHLLLLEAKDPIQLPYGHSSSVIFKMVNREETGDFELSCGDCPSAWIYLQGDKESQLQFSFVTPGGLIKKFSLNTKITKIVIDQDAEERSKAYYQEYHHGEQNEGVYTFYKIVSTQHGIPSRFRAMKLCIGHSHFDINGCIRPKFVPTDEYVDVSPDSINELRKSGIFKDFSLRRWGFRKVKKRRLPVQTEPKRIIKRPEDDKKMPQSFRQKAFHYLSIIAIVYTFGSLFCWLIKKSIAA
jgi:hypothetical protein